MHEHLETAAQQAGRQLFDPFAIPDGGVCGLFGASASAEPRTAELEDPYGITVDVDPEDDDQSILQELMANGLLPSGSHELEIARTYDGLEIIDPNNPSDGPILTLMQAARRRTADFPRFGPGRLLTYDEAVAWGKQRKSQMYQSAPPGSSGPDLFIVEEPMAGGDDARFAVATEEEMAGENVVARINNDGSVDKMASRRTAMTRDDAYQKAQGEADRTGVAQAIAKDEEADDYTFMPADEFEATPGASYIATISPGDAATAQRTAINWGEAEVNEEMDAFEDSTRAVSGRRRTAHRFDRRVRTAGLREDLDSVIEDCHSANQKLGRIVLPQSHKHLANDIDNSRIYVAQAGQVLEELVREISGFSEEASRRTAGIDDLSPGDGVRGDFGTGRVVRKETHPDFTGPDGPYYLIQPDSGGAPMIRQRDELQMVES